ncbi:MAG TPA: HlyD family efflux transporter periplasmic adaptor subunit [Chitinophaga sp.]|uniref:HlyD family secretion protein n=1 Tax=Chitinophaga sp. TaxID=1869181 RepID=UPI002C39E020|nr:HlyD family efflux transporter periplasmic adaptor subunit [Chitinophaga sp.]HVI45615.1 HlyD family efflux transporter periplasmic adaptor subunit [Chitinophaga sp.]
MKAANIAMIAIPLVALLACSSRKHTSDAYGNFEAVETVVGAESTGKLLVFGVEEGMTLPADTVVGWIDSTQLHLKRTQLQANIRAVLSKTPDTQPQLQVISEQIARQKVEQRRITNLLNAHAATPKQLDDINAQIAVLEKQYRSLASSLQTQVSGIHSETQPLQAQVAQVADQLTQSRVVNPVNGTVLVKYVEKGEIITYGKALYKIADLSDLILRAYISEEQLGQVKTGQQVTVLTDQPEGKYREWPGIITWIAAEAEFTPKIIQTKEERVNLVYAVKVKVKNDGSLKIGMPAELLFAKK